MENREKLEIPTIEFTQVVTLLSATSGCEIPEDPNVEGSEAEVSIRPTSG